MTSTTVRLRGVAHRYGRVAALRDVGLELGRGVTGILGPNGAGKTTLMRILATVLTPDAGEITLLGGDPGRADELRAIRRRIGYLPQEPAFYRGFTVFEFVDYVAILKEMVDAPTRHAEVRRVLDVFALRDVASRRIRHLSAGMRQRLALAQALLGTPDLLLLDEPIDGLDPEQRLRFRRTISELAAHATVVLSTHRTEDVAAICGRVIVLDRGVVRFDGAPQELAKLAEGHTWYTNDDDPSARASWRTGDGRHRVLGAVAPPGATPAAPTIEDGYLLLIDDHEAGVPR